MKKKILVCFLLIVILVPSYFKIKAVLIKNDVKDYLITEKNVKEKNIKEIKPYYNFFKDGTKCTVRVILKGDKGIFYYYVDSKTDKILLDSYYLKGYGYSAVEYEKMIGKKP
ncbi:DUF3139 domain-containing protein [Gottfriedia luciferensis]|uniref:DUF3139 domain-containing protein n=1 Tax=Gottfriedia luciferensis TaxID=178774 RepID=UPI000B444B7A|nr:DUF3139 domain-containing protein [Gottfriedia luciferensis]